VGLGGVLDEDETLIVADIPDRPGVAGLAVEVDADHGLRLRGDLCEDVGRVDRGGRRHRRRQRRAPPAHRDREAVAKNVNAGTTTSSPGPTPAASSAAWRAVVPFETATAWGTAVGGELFLKGGGDRTLGDHAGGEDSENGVVLLVPEGRLGDGYVHGSLSPEADVIFFRVGSYTGLLLRVK
jgi:hypothetical protein